MYCTIVGENNLANAAIHILTALVCIGLCTVCPFAIKACLIYFDIKDFTIKMCSFNHFCKHLLCLKAKCFHIFPSMNNIYRNMVHTKHISEIFVNFSLILMMHSRREYMQRVHHHLYLDHLVFVIGTGPSPSASGIEYEFSSNYNIPPASPPCDAPPLFTLKLMEFDLFPIQHLFCQAYNYRVVDLDLVVMIVVVNI